MQPINDRIESNVLVVSIEDTKSLNGSTPEEIRKKLQETLALHQNVKGIVLDLSKVDMITSTAVATLVLLRKSVHASSRRLILAVVHPDVLNSLKILRLDKLFEMSEEVPSAVAAIASA